MFATVRLPSPISDADLHRIGEENPGWKVEFVDGAICMTPTSYESGRQNAKLTALLVAWADGHGYTATDSSTGYKLPDGNVLSPDGALLRSDRLALLTEEERQTYCILVPDVVVELASKSDSIAVARKKCERWHRDGAGYVLLLDPKHAATETWGVAPADFPKPDAILAGLIK